MISDFRNKRKQLCLKKWLKNICVKMSHMSQCYNLYENVYEKKITEDLPFLRQKSFS